MKSMKLDASKFSERLNMNCGDVTYVIHRSFFSKHYQWTVYVNDTIVDEHDRHDEHTYTDRSGVCVSGFYNVEEALDHMNQYAKDPKDYVRDYCGMMIDQL